MMQSVTILGSTGSIGVSTLDVLQRHPQRFSVFALTANRRYEALAQQCLQYQPRYAVLRDADAAEQLRQQLLDSGAEATQILCGEAGLDEVAGSNDVDTVVAAIVGAAGLKPTLTAVRAGKKVLLANKEALVMAGELFMQAVEQNGAQLLPIDSEHNAIFQCLPPQFGNVDNAGVRKILLTGSGGPFRTTALEALESVTPDQACAHPNWSMGRKISVDSATMMNKGLEFIEACRLFSVRPQQIEVVVHPQSIVHSMVEYRDGSVLAQLGNPDMRTPIAHALAWPERIDAGVANFDLIALSRLDFEAPNLQHFPCLGLAMAAAAVGKTAPALLNAANEVAVAAFLDGQLRFPQIAMVIEKVLEQIPTTEPRDLGVVQQADLQAREAALCVVDNLKRINA